MASVKITFIGHASFRFESDKGSVTYFDAWARRQSHRQDEAQPS